MDRPKDLAELRLLYQSGEVTASELAREIQHSKSTVHNALSTETDPRHSLVVEMIEGARRILAEKAEAKGAA